MVKIVQKEASVLREIAKEVPIDEITSPRIKKIIKDMKKALASQDDGVAIAAPQIGESLRIFVLSGRAIEITQKKKDDDDKMPDDMVFINPRILKTSRDREMMEEGCLSIRYYYGKVSRAKKASVEAYNEEGKKFTKGGSGLIAQIFQHEIDHLDGVLFTDKAQDLVDIPPEEQETMHDAAEDGRLH